MKLKTIITPTVRSDMFKIKLVAKLIGSIVVLLLFLAVTGVDAKWLRRVQVGVRNFPSLVQPYLSKEKLPAVQQLPNPDAVQLTPPATYIVMGDTGSGDANQYTVAKTIKSFCDQVKNCQAIFIAGDVIYEEGVKSIDDPIITERFTKPYKDIDLPFYIAYGNHDYLGCRDCYLQMTGKVTNWQMPAAYYLTSFGLVEFSTIDTESLDQKQLDWLLDTLKYDHKKYFTAPEFREWQIVIGHRPMTSNEESKVSENFTGKDDLKEVLCAHADVYISGHAHLMEDNQLLSNNSSECKTRLLVAGTGGASLRTSVDKYPADFTASEYGFLALTPSERGPTECPFSDSKKCLALTYEFISTTIDPATSRPKVLHQNTIYKQFISYQK